MTFLASPPRKPSTDPGWMPLVAVCLGTFMLLVDVSVVNVALPDMAHDLHASLTGLEWVVDAYALALAALLMLVGSLSDVVGRKRTYLVGLVVFVVASLGCAVAPSEAVLISARVVQGTGGAAMFATTIALLSKTYSGEKRGTAFGVWGATSGAAAAAGPIVGGLLTQTLSWRWVFFVNIPIGIITILVAQRSLAKDDTAHGATTDWFGGATFTVCAATLTYAVVRVDAIGWDATETLILLMVAAAALGAFIVIELRSPAPLLDLSLLRGRLTPTLIAAALYSASAFATLVYASLWLQTVLNLSPIAAGLVTFPMMIFGFVVSAGGGKRLHAAPTRLIIAGGLALIGAGDLLQFGIGGGSDWPRLILGFVVTGIGVGALAPILASAAMDAVPPERAGMAAGAVNTARQIGLAFGIAAFGSVFATRITHGLATEHHGATMASQVTSGGANSILANAPAATRATLDVTIHSAVASGLSSTFLVAGIAGLGGAALSLLLLSLRLSHRALRHAPWEVTPSRLRDRCNTHRRNPMTTID